MKTLRFRHEKLKELREQMGASQQELANAISARYKKEGVTVSQGFISKMEVGDKGPGLETLAVLVDFFGVGYDYFLEGLDEGNNDKTHVVHARTTEEAQTIRAISRRMGQLPDDERNEIFGIAALMIDMPLKDIKMLRRLINDVIKLTPQERDMIGMLAQRLSETQPLNTQTTEADQAADIINKLPELERGKALVAVRGVAVDLTQEIADKRASVAALLSVVDDVSDVTVRNRLRVQVAESFSVDLDSIK
jgi:transcriptional regulator with XRE-family HTH domain